MSSENTESDTDQAIDFYKLSDLEILEDEYETLEDLDITNSSLLKSQHIFKSVLDTPDTRQNPAENYKRYKQSEQLKEITERANEISDQHLELHQFVSKDGGGDGDVLANIVPAVFVLHYEIENIISYNVGKTARTDSNVSIRLTRPIVNIIDEIPADDNIKSLFDTPDSDISVFDTLFNNNTNDNSAEEFLSTFKRKVVSETPDIIFATPENYYILCIFGLSQAIIKCFLVERNQGASSQSESVVQSTETKRKKGKSTKKQPASLPKQIVAQIPYIPYRFSFGGIIGSTRDLLYVDAQNINIKSDSSKAAAFFNKYSYRLNVSVSVDTNKKQKNLFSKTMIKQNLFSKTMIKQMRIFDYFSGFGPNYLLKPDKPEQNVPLPLNYYESMPYFYFRSFIKRFSENPDIRHKLFEISLLCFSTIYKDNAEVNPVANNATSQSGQTPPPNKNEVLVLDDIDVSSATAEPQPITTRSLLVNTGIYRKLKTISKAVQSAFYKDTYKKYLYKRNDADNAEKAEKNDADNAENIGNNLSEQPPTESHSESVNKTKETNLLCIFKYINDNGSLHLQPKILLHWAVFSSLIQKWIGIHDYYIVSGVFVGQNSSSQLNAQPTKPDPQQKPVDTMRKRIFRYIYSFKRDEIMTEMMAVLRNGIITNKKMIYNPYFVVNDIRNIIETRKNTYQLSEEYSKLERMPLNPEPTEEIPRSSEKPSDSQNSTISSKDLKISSVLTPEISLDINDIKVDLQSFVSTEPITKPSNSEDENSTELIGITIDDVLIEVNVAIDSAITDSLIPKTETSEQPEGVAQGFTEEDSSSQVEGANSDDQPISTSDGQPTESASASDPQPPHEQDISTQIEEARRKLEEVQKQRKALETKLANAKKQSQSEDGTFSLNEMSDNADQSNDQTISESRKLLEACIDAKQTIYKISIMAALQMMSQSNGKTGGAKGGRGRRRRKIGGDGALSQKQKDDVSKLLEESKEVFLGKATPNEQPVTPGETGSDSNPQKQTDEAIKLLDGVSAELNNILDKINANPENIVANSNNVDTGIASQESASETATNNTMKDPTITISLSFTTDEYKPVENESNGQSPTTLVETPVQSPNQAYDLFIVEISTSVENLFTIDNPIDSVLSCDANVLMKDKFLDDIMNKTTNLNDNYNKVKETLLAKMKRVNAHNDNTTNEGDAGELFTSIDEQFVNLIKKIESKQVEVNAARTKATKRDELGCLDIALYGMIREEVQKKSSKNKENPVLTPPPDYTQVKKYSKWVDDIINKRTLGAVSQETTTHDKANELIVV